MQLENLNCLNDYYVEVSSETWIAPDEVMVPYTKYQIFHAINDYCEVVLVITKWVRYYKASLIFCYGDEECDADDTWTKTDIKKYDKQWQIGEFENFAEIWVGELLQWFKNEIELVIYAHDSADGQWL